MTLSITRWFALVVGGLVLVSAIGLGAVLIGLGRQDDRRALLLDRIAPAEGIAQRIPTAVLDQESSVRGFVLTGEDQYLAGYRDGRERERLALAELRELQATGALASLRDELAAVEERAGAWRADYAEPAIAARRAGDDPPDPALGDRRFDDLRAAIDAEQRELIVERRMAGDELRSAARAVRVLFLAAGVLLLLSVLVAAYALRRGVILPLARLAHDVREVARGQFDRELDPSGPTEIEALGRDVDAMRARIVSELAALRDAEVALIEQARELQRSNEELEQFAYVASHDLQEPLRKVASFTQMLQRRYDGQLDERADRYIEFAVDGARRMQDLINDLLEFSRVGRVTGTHETVAARDLVDAATERLSALLEDAGAEVVVEGELPEVTGDRGLLTNVFQNLIGNGIKFRGDAPPRIEISARREGPAWRFEVTDNGIGVEDEYADRIFIIFQRLHTRDAYEGTGIGLAMCRKIIEHHGGRITLAPAEPGRGARFVFTLPAADTQEESTQ